ncbi:MAG: RES domain-containing protein [Gammaproteobacteria bacterium]|nr:MAG: RES domain-containing protein [Gammaproteobacteria bacterium]QMU62650.1 MAG: RES domain-containing protein [Gammaproteobacteria bacterium]
MSLTIQQENIKPLSEVVFRVAESQQKVATNTLVDTLQEQRILEELLDRVKPPIPYDCQQYDYLVYTPFRYPPLKHGSRFGKKMHPSIFYGSKKLDTAFAELAYYRFVYYDGMMALPKKKQKVTQHASFSVELETQKGVALNESPFNKLKHKISNPNSYGDSQKIGEEMRVKEVEAFTYFSARADEEVNVGIFSCKVIASYMPNALQHWSCITRDRSVTIRSLDDRWSSISFELDQFLVDGVLPAPAV